MNSQAIANFWDNIGLMPPAAIRPLVVESWEAAAPHEVLERLPRRPFRFLLESQGGPREITRWSFLGHQPFLRFESRGRRLTVWEAGEMRRWEGDPIKQMGAVLARFQVQPAPGLPPFTGGAVGYFSYDLGRQFERLPNTARDDLELPDICLAFYDHLLAFDHTRGVVHAVAVPLPGREAEAVGRARALARISRQTSDFSHQPSVIRHRSGKLESNFTREAYCRAVERALEYIGDGYIYQVNLAQRFAAPLPEGAEALYQRLRARNPAPFAAFFDAGDFQVVSASPERFLQYDAETRRVETRPIKGTRPRGATPEDDARLQVELLASAKDAAELVMIVDLERNDLGRVCDYGTVRVADLRRVEAYPTVFHTVATVEGRLHEGRTVPGLLRATFPGGSITGAPKIRAMHIIEELEGLRRGVYCGAVGYLGFDKRLDLNVAIRTVVVKGGRAYFHAGGGIVADSTPDGEYEETLHKANALANAVGYPTLGGVGG